MDAQIIKFLFFIKTNFFTDIFPVFRLIYLLVLWMSVWKIIDGSTERKLLCVSY